MKQAILVAALLAALPGLSVAQEQYLELLRADLKTEKTAILTENLEMTEAESQLFWPLYREYDLKLSALQDERIAFIKDYAAGYETMGGEMAGTLTEKAMDLAEKRLKLRREYFKKISKAVNPVVASRFVHVESLIGNLVDLKVQSEVPMAPRNPAPQGGGQN